MSTDRERRRDIARTSAAPLAQRPSPRKIQRHRQQAPPSTTSTRPDLKTKHADDIRPFLLPWDDGWTDRLEPSYLKRASRNTVNCPCNIVLDDREERRKMICCDHCETWQHMVCLGLPEDYAPEPPSYYFCHVCVPDRYRAVKGCDGQLREVPTTKRQPFQTLLRSSSQDPADAIGAIQPNSGTQLVDMHGKYSDGSKHSSRSASSTSLRSGRTGINPMRPVQTGANHDRGPERDVQATKLVVLRLPTKRVGSVAHGEALCTAAPKTPHKIKLVIPRSMQLSDTPSIAHKGDGMAHKTRTVRLRATPETEKPIVVIKAEQATPSPAADTAKTYQHDAKRTAQAMGDSATEQVPGQSETIRSRAALLDLPMILEGKRQRKLTFKAVKATSIANLGKVVTPGRKSASPHEVACSLADAPVVESAGCPSRRVDVSPVVGKMTSVGTRQRVRRRSSGGDFHEP
ncbi:hypothetical protein PYCC9005_003062 [Savitreella phatthalungensis]